MGQGGTHGRAWRVSCSGTKNCTYRGIAYNAPPLGLFMLDSRKFFGVSMVLRRKELQQI